MVRRILVLLVVLFACGATPAQAGGPTSVLLSAPPYVMAVGYQDQRYYDLQNLTQTSPAGDDSSEAHDIGRFVRATWLVHDMSVWRIDVIYPDAPGGPWISTEEFLTETKPAKPTWHRAADPVKLLRLLDSFKLLNGKFDGGPTLDDGYTIAEPTPTPVVEQTPPQAQTSTAFFTGWRWSIPGAILGAAAAVIAIRLFPKRRWDLLD
jgi:hypothetical protein